LKFKRANREELAINMTPLIDVVFLLLIFFMVTTTFSRETRLLVNLPEANAEAAQSNPAQIEIPETAAFRSMVEDWSIPESKR
jgi:biopolymer transport protein ExbD